MIMLQMMLDAKSMRCTKPNKGSHNLTLPKPFIHDNGTKESISFSNVTWSRDTSKYMEFIKTGLQNSSFDKIIEKAQEMMASTYQLQMDNTTIVNDFIDIQLVDLLDEDCKLKLSH